MKHSVAQGIGFQAVVSGLWDVFGAQWAVRGMTKGVWPPHAWYVF